jgi:hypothetical protein
VLCAAAHAAAHAWRWCGGWAPNLWPAYAALHDVADWAMLIDLMQTIRDAD